MAVTFSYLVSQHLKKIITVNHDIKGCRNLGQYCSKLPTDNITFSYLFRLTILQHFKQIFVAVIRLHNFGSNLVQITQFPQEIFFGEIECYYCLPTVFYQATTFKKVLRWQIMKQGCTILAQSGPKLSFLPNRNFLEKLHNIALVYYI